jgi:hypothetical protein
MKIAIQIEVEEVAFVKSDKNIAPAEVLERAAILGAEDAGPAPALAFGKAPTSSPAIDCGEAPKVFQSDATPEMQALEPSIEPTEAKDAGKAAPL